MHLPFISSTTKVWQTCFVTRSTYKDSSCATLNFIDFLVRYLCHITCTWLRRECPFPQSRAFKSIVTAWFMRSSSKSVIYYRNVTHLSLDKATGSLDTVFSGVLICSITDVPWKFGSWSYKGTI